MKDIGNGFPMDNADLPTRVMSLEALLHQLSSERDILAVIYRYARAADRCDIDLMKSCYHSDATDDHGFYSGNAWEFCDFVIPQLRALELSVHSMSNTIIELKGDRAFAETHYAVIHRLKQFLGFTDFYHHGRYLDVFECRSGKWKIACRVICQDGERWLQTANLYSIISRSPNFPIQGSQGKGDPVYVAFDLPSLIRMRPRMQDLWIGFVRIALTPLFLVRLVALTWSAFRPK